MQIDAVIHCHFWVNTHTGFNKWEYPHKQNHCNKVDELSLSDKGNADYSGLFLAIFVIHGVIQNLVLLRHMTYSNEDTTHDKSNTNVYLAI